MAGRSACPVCGGAAAGTWTAGLLRCGACTHVWADMTVGDDELRGLYGRSYFFGEEYSSYLGDRVMIEKNFSRRLATLRPFLHEEHRRLFEVGCAYGLFLNLARPLFASVSGVDISADAVGYATRELGVNARCGDLLSMELDDRSIDVACMWDTVEHLADPRPYVDALAQHMPAGGLIAMTTGDIGSVNARVQKGRWRLIHPPTHLQYFTRQSMTALLEASGFRVRHVEHCGFYRSIGGMLHNVVAIKWNRPAIASRLQRLVPSSLGVYLNLYDIMYVIAERQ